MDIRTYIGYDIAEYPDSEKILIAPAMEVFNKNMQVSYFEGEKNIRDIWKQIERRKE